MYGHFIARAAPSAGCWLFMWGFLAFWWIPIHDAPIMV